VKAVLCKQFGTPADLVIEEVAAPQMAPDQVRIAVKACGVNFPDILMIAGKYQVKPPLPFSPGAELSGEILAVGDKVEHLKPGQRVLAMHQYGCMAEEVCLPAAAIVPIPDSMDYVTAASFILTYGTSYHALKQRAALKSGESLLVLGAAGGVGLAAVEIGNLFGAEVFAAASSAAKLELAGQYGATHLINYTESSLKEQVKELTGGRGVDVIYDPVGGDLFDDCLRSISWGGRILVIGFASGKIPAIPANLPLLKGSSVVGVFWGQFTQREPSLSIENTNELLQLFDEGKLKPHVSGTYPLAQASDALLDLAERRAMGKVVVMI
jgi:NADPH2:quinone reductase